MEKLIKKTQFFFKTDMSYLVKGGFWLTFGKSISLFSALITSIVFANFLSENTYGVFRYVLSIGGILAILTLRGIDTSLSRATAKGEAGLIKKAFKTKLKWGSLATAFGLAGAFYYYLNSNTELALTLLISALFIPLMEASYVYMGYLNGRKLFDQTIKYHFFEKILVTTSLVLLAIYNKNVVFIILGYYLSYSLIRFIFYKNLEKKDPEQNNETEFLSFGKHLSLIGAITSVATYLDKILVFHYIGAAQLAGYYLALVPFKQTQNLLSSLRTLAFPKFSINNKADLRKTLPRKILKIYTVVLPIILLYWFVAPYLFELIYPVYTEYSFISKIIFIQLIFFPLKFLQTALTAQEQKKELYTISTTYTTIRVVLLLILTPILGLSGVVASIIITNAIDSLLTLKLFLKK